MKITNGVFQNILPTESRWAIALPTPYTNEKINLNFLKGHYDAAIMTQMASWVEYNNLLDAIREEKREMKVTTTVYSERMRNDDYTGRVSGGNALVRILQVSGLIRS